MNMEIGTEGVQFPEKEYIMGFSIQCIMNTMVLLMMTMMVILMIILIMVIMMMMIPMIMALFRMERMITST